MSSASIPTAGYVVVYGYQQGAQIYGAGRTRIMSYKRAVKALGRNVESLHHIPASDALVRMVMSGVINPGYEITTGGVAITLDEAIVSDLMGDNSF